MQMTDDEIRKRYKHAENKDAQTRILAELNACPVAKIQQIIGGGPAEPVKKSHALFKELYDEGKSDSEIAAKAGVIPNTVWAWRNKNKLPPNQHPKKEKPDKKAPEIPQTFSMEPVLASTIAGGLIASSGEYFTDVLKADTPKSYINDGEVVLIGECLNAPDISAATIVMRDGGTRVSIGTGALREDEQGKGRYDLIPPEPMRRLAIWYELGAKKYGDRNWESGLKASRCLSAALRHLFKYLGGLRDEDHLAAVAWNVFAIMHYEKHHPEMFGDLPKI